MVAPLTMKLLAIGKAVPESLRTDTEANTSSSSYTATNQPLINKANFHWNALFKRAKYLRKSPLAKIAQHKLFMPIEKEQAVLLQKNFEALYLLEEKLVIIPGIPPQGLPSTALSSSIKVSSMMARRALLKSTFELVAS